MIMIWEIEFMWYENLGSFNDASNQRFLASRNVKPVYFDMGQAEPTVSKFSAAKTNRILSKTFIKLVIEKWAILIVFGKRDGLRYFFDDYRRLIVENNRYSCPLPGRDGYTDRSWVVTVIYALDSTLQC